VTQKLMPVFVAMYFMCAIFKSKTTFLTCNINYNDNLQII